MIGRSVPPRKVNPKRRASYIKKSTKPIRKVNPVAKAKRDARNAKDRRSPHVKEIRRQAFERAGNQCEYRMARESGISMHLGHGAWIHNMKVVRCFATEALELHHLHYPKVRPLGLQDVQILCRAHHREAESRKLHKANRRTW